MPSYEVFSMVGLIMIGMIALFFLFSDCLCCYLSL